MDTHYNLFDKNNKTLTNRNNLAKEIHEIEKNQYSEKESSLGTRELKDSLNEQHKLVSTTLKENKEVRTGSYYNISDGHYSFYVQDLYNKGLFYDEGIGKFDTEAFEIMKLTDFGINFLNFIKSAPPN